MRETFREIKEDLCGDAYRWTYEPRRLYEEWIRPTVTVRGLVRPDRPDSDALLIQYVAFRQFHRRESVFQKEFRSIPPRFFFLQQKLILQHPHRFINNVYFLKINILC